MGQRKWWDLAAIVVVVVACLLGTTEPPFGTDDWVVLGTSAVFLLVHFAAGRRTIGAEKRWQPLVAAAYAVIVLLIGCVFDPSYAIMQVFIYPYLWTTAPSTRVAIVENVAVALGLLIGYWIGGGTAWLLSGLATAGLSLGFSLVLGLWITRIANFSEERGRLLDELQAAQGELAAMHRAAGVEAERARLARELHDTIAQSLTGLVMVAQRAGRDLGAGRTDAAGDDLGLIEQMAREALTETRSLVAASAPAPDGASLAEALDRLGRSFARETGLVVEVDAGGAEGIGRELEVVLLRAAQEGLANVRKHARAARATVTVRREASDAVLEVVDDGVGPAPDAGSPGDGGFGLSGLHDRVGLVGGRVEFGATAGGGARLRVRVPAGGAGDGAASDEEPGATASVGEAAERKGDA